MNTSEVKSLLIVEDDAGAARLQQQRLERAGFKTVTATSTEQALAIVDQGGIELVVLDYRLPGSSNGLDFYAQLKAAGHDLPVIMVTGYSDEATVIRALRTGVRDFLTKSVEYLDYLPKAVERVLKQVRTEQDLADSESRMAGIIGAAMDGIITIDGQSRIVDFNPAAEQIFGYAREQVVGRDMSEFIVPPPLRQLHKAGIARFLATGQGEIFGKRLEMAALRADGSQFAAELTVTPISGGSQPIFTGFIRDISEHKLAQARLLEQATLLDKAHDAILVKDLDDRVLYWNQGAERLYGWAADEALGRDLKELLYNTRSLELEQANSLATKTGEWSGQLHQLGKDGQGIIVDSRWTLVRDADGRPKSALVINTDVTEKKKIEMQFLHAQRMESVGTLAGGVAHDFNNLLTVILGYSEMLLSIHEADGSSDVEFLQQIFKAAERASLLTRQLLAFSRKQVLEPRILDLNAVVADTEKMLRRLIGEDILVRAVLAPSLDCVSVDPGQIEQVLMNLAVNARDAMPQGGELTIETANVELDEDYARSHSEVQPGRYVMLAVSDSGCGMDNATKAQIFEPFFTTKELGKGTGLGLATVYGIVKQSGGHVWVCSELGQGTTFKIYLPVKQAAVRAGEPAGVQQSALYGQETVLLVEDEDNVRALSRHALQTFGYMVLEARNPLEAVQLSEAHLGDIHLLVTDVIMPQLNGRRLAELLQPRRPAMKVLYVSGYTDDAIMRQGILHADVSFLQKPFTPLLLGTKVREVLNRSLV